MGLGEAGWSVPLLLHSLHLAPWPHLICQWSREVYHKLREVFYKQLGLSLPPQCPYDCATEFHAGALLPGGRLYNLSQPEQEAMESLWHTG